MRADTRKYNATYNYMKGNFEIKNYQRNMKVGDTEFLKWKLAWCHLVRICWLSDGGLCSRTLWAFYLLAYSRVMWGVAKQQSVSLLNKSQVQISLPLLQAFPWRHCSLSISWIALILNYDFESGRMWGIWRVVFISSMWHLHHIDRCWKPSWEHWKNKEIEFKIKYRTC